MARITEPELRSWLRLARSVALFVGGFAGVAYETVVSHAERPTLLVLFTAMMGLPFALRADEKTQQTPPPAPKPDETEKTSP